jgi:hypothetical protein
MTILCGNPGGCSPEGTAVPVGFHGDAKDKRLDDFIAEIDLRDRETDFTVSTWRGHHQMAPSSWFSVG